MSVRTALAITFVAALTTWSVGPNPACAQGAQTKPGDFEINSIRLLSRQAPKYSGANTGDLGGDIPAANKPWLRIEVEFESKPDWADDVQLKYHVLMGKGKEAKLFVSDVTLVNVSKGSKHYSAMFLHPNTLDRFGGGRVEGVAIVLYHQNRPLAFLSEPKTKERWWERYSPTPGFLLSPRDTPWSVLAYQRYEQQKTGQ